MQAVYGLFDFQKGKCIQVFLAKDYAEAKHISDMLKQTNYKDQGLALGYIDTATPKIRSNE